MGKRRHLGLALAVFAGVALVAFRPLFFRWNTLPTYERGSTPAMALADRNLNLWILAWVAHALLTDPAHLFDGNILYPARDTLAGSEHMLAHVPFTVPAMLLSGNAAYVLKAMMLESIILTALAAYLVVRHHTGDTAAALVAGTLLTLSPWRFEPRGVIGGVAAEPQYLGFQFLPLALLALALYLERGRWLALLGFAAAMALQALASFYLGYAAFATVPVYAAALLLAARRDGAREADARTTGRLALGVVLGLLVAALAVLPMGLPYLRLRASGVVPAYDIDFVAQLSTPPWSYLGWSGFALVGPVAAALTVGFAIVRLFGLVLRRANRLGLAGPSSGEIAAWVLLASGLVLGWGPYQDLPGGLRLPLPFAILWKLVPGFSAMRGAGRFVVIVSLGCALLAGYAVAAARAWIGRGVAAVAAAAIGAALFLAAREPVPAVQSGVGADAAPAYRFLADRPPGESVLELPAKAGEDDLFGLTIDSQYMLASTVHWQPILNGYTAYEPPQRDVLAAIAQRLPAPDALDRLLSLVDVRWVLVHRALLDARQRAAFDDVPAGLDETSRFGDDVLYEVTAEPTVSHRARLFEPDAAKAASSLEGAARSPLAPACRVGALRIAAAGPLRHAYRKARLQAEIENLSTCAWPALGVGHDGLVMLDYEWLEGDRVVVRGAPGRLTRDVRPMASIEEPLFVFTPRGPGTYRLRVSLRQQGSEAAIATWEGDFQVDAARGAAR